MANASQNYSSSSDEESYLMIDGSNERMDASTDDDNGNSSSKTSPPLVTQQQEQRESEKGIKKRKGNDSLEVGERTGLQTRIEHLEAELESRKTAEQELRAEKEELAQSLADQKEQQRLHLEKVEKEWTETREKSNKELKAANEQNAELRKLMFKYKSQAESAASHCSNEETINRLTKANEENMKTIANLVDLLKSAKMNDEVAKMSEALEKMTIDKDRITAQLHKEQSELEKLKIRNEFYEKRLKKYDEIRNHCANCTSERNRLLSATPDECQPADGVPTAALSSDSTAVEMSRQSYFLSVGNLPYLCEERALMDFLNERMSQRCLASNDDPVIACKFDDDACRGLIELTSEVDAIVALTLNGIPFMGEKLEISRPPGYRPIPDEYMSDSDNESDDDTATADRPAQIVEEQIVINSEPAPVSTVLRLANLITEAELADGYDYDDLLAQILEECDRFGLVRSVEATRPWKVQNGKVYIEFETTAGCEKAKTALHGMAVSDRSIVASYYDVDKYQNIVSS